MDQDQPQTSDGEVQEKALRNGGFSDDDINSWKADTANKLSQGGFSPDEVRQYFGTKEPDMAPSKKIVDQNLKSATKEKREPIDPSAKPIEAKDIWDAMAAGWATSFSGLFLDNEKPPIEVPQDATRAMKIASSMASMAGDLPAMAAGATAAAPLGPVAQGAAAFAVPQAMRKVLMDHYEKGDIQSASDFADRVVGTTWEAAKGAITGGATAFSGGVAGAAYGTAAKMAAEVTAMTTVSKGLEGHLPNADDFINGAIAIGGLHAVSVLPGKLRNIYAETGAQPHEILEAANKNPTLKGELLSSNPDLPQEAAPTSEPPLSEQEAPEQSAKSQDQTLPEDAKSEVLSRIGEQEKPEGQSLSDKFHQLYSESFDYTHAIGQVIKESGIDVPDEKNAQVLMRLQAAHMDLVKSFVEDGTRDFNTFEKNGESLTKIFDDYKEEFGDKTLSDLKAFGISARTLELNERGIEQPGNIENDRKIVEAGEEKYRPYLDRLVDYKNRVLDYMHDSGFFNQKQVDSMKDLNQSYFSFHKIQEADDLTGKISGKSNGLRMIGDSTKQLVDPIVSTLKDVDLMLRLAEENRVKNTFVENMMSAEDPSAFIRKVKPDMKAINVSAEELRAAGVEGDAKALTIFRPRDRFLTSTQFETYVDGKRQIFEAPEGVVDSLNRMSGDKTAIGMWSGLMKPFATSTRVMTVNNPLFAIRHAWRNQFAAATFSQTGLKPFEALLSAPKFLMKGEDYQNFIANGGAVSSIMPMDKGYVDGKIYELDEKAPMLDKAWNTVKDVAGFSHWMISLNDNIVRFAENQRLLQKGETPEAAAFGAREVLPDFQKAGLQRSALRTATAFLNVHLQGQARMVQEFGDNPAGYIAKNLAYITVPSLLLAAANAGDDRVADLPNWQKYMYWTTQVDNWRPANSLAEAMSEKSAYPSAVRQNSDGSYMVNAGHIIRIQKPFTNGIIFGSMVEAALDSYKKGNPAGFEDFLKTTAGSMFVEPIPNILSPIVEQGVNRNFYTGQPLVSASKENKLPEYGYDPYTSETAKIIGKSISYVPLFRDLGPQDAKLSSPKVIENYIHSWGGTMGQYVVDVLDKGLRASGVAPPDVKPTATLEDLPFINELMIRNPSIRPQSVADFEDRYKQANRVQATIKDLMRSGQADEAIKVQSRYALNMDRLVGVDTSLQRLNSAIQKINMSPDIKPNEKRQMMETFMYEMAAQAKMGNQLMDEFEKTANAKNAGR